MIKFLISLLFITTNAFSLTPIVKLQFNKNINKNINKNVIHNVNFNSKIIMSIPDYDPSIIINQLANKSNNLDKYNLKQFLHEVNTHHIDSVSLIKDMNTNTINSLVAIDNNFEGAIPKLENLHYLETGLTKVNNLVIDSLLNNDIYYKINYLWV